MKITVAWLVFLIYCCGFAQSGDVDPTFGINGKTVTGFGTNRNTANAVAFQPDGKFIVGGSYISNRGDSDWAIVRYAADGTLDPAFGNDGKIVTGFVDLNNDSNSLHSLYVLQDGKILALGASGKTGFPPKLIVVRYHANGTIDTGFANNGRLSSQLIPFTDFGSKLVFQPDGKFLLTSCKQYPADPNYHLGVERYTADGVLDTAFGTNGLAATSFGTGLSAPTAIALQADGKIVVAGKYQPTNSRQWAIARFNADGTPDAGFDGDGKALTAFGGAVLSEAMEVAVGTDGKIKVAGVVYGATRSFALVQYNANGSLDASFGTDGKAMSAFTDVYDGIRSVTRQADGKYLVVMKSDNFALTASDLRLRRYNGNVSPDSDFGTNGEVSTTFGTGTNGARSAGVAPGGKIVLVGESIPADFGNFDFAVARYSANGILDATLDGDGKITTAFEKGNDQLNHLLIAGDDTILAIGTSAYRQSNNALVRNIALAKYDSNGQLDAAFGTAGKVTSVFGLHYNYVTAAALQPDGKIVLANTYYNPTVDNLAHYELIRYNANGSLDASFGTNGKATIGFEAVSIALQADGRIVIAGVSSPDGSVNGFTVGRFSAVGMPDNSFDADATAFVPFGNAYFGKVSVLPQATGKIVVTGSASSPDSFNNNPAFVAVRFNADGSLDPTFGTNGKTATLIHDNCFAYAGFSGTDRTITMAGVSFGGSAIYFSSLRYAQDGTLDTAYGTNGIASSPLAYDYRIINSILLQPDGKLLVALSQYNQPPNSYDFRIRRFNPDGSFDSGFGGSTGISTSFYNGYDEVFAIGLQSGHKIIAGGTTSNGIANDFALTRYANSVLNAADFETADSLILYPNPVEGILHVKPDGNTVIQECCVFNMLGQMVCKTSGTAIDTASFGQGVYTLRVKTDKGMLTKKFIRK